MKTKFFIVLILSSIIFSCSGNTIDKRIVELNNYGVKLHLTFQKDSMLKAIKVFDKAIEIKPDYYLSYINKASLQNYMGDLKGAIKTLKNAKKVFPTSFEVKFKLAIYSEKSGDSIKAQYLYKEMGKEYEKVIDTLNVTKKENYKFFKGYIFNLILLKQNSKADSILMRIKYLDEPEVELMKRFMNMDRSSFINSIN